MRQKGSWKDFKRWVSIGLSLILLDFYSSFASREEACKVFDEMPHKDTVAWNVLISCYLRNGRSKDVLMLFDSMKNENFCQPDNVTCLFVTQACANLGALEFGEKVHRYIEERGYGSARNRSKNVVSWSAMISGLAMNGYGRDAILAFEEMQRMRVSPDEQTFTLREFFPLLCRFTGSSLSGHNINECSAGCNHLEDLAWSLKNPWSFHTWRTTGNWEKVMELRKFLKDKGTQTTPGCCSIEIKGVVHDFVVDDISYPRKHEIYDKLDEINKQLKIAGYITEMTSELHDLGAEEKANALCYHSEKLALALGVLATPPGVTLRITKNLRICIDCHKFAKFHFWGV
ncbi:hypothetical protein F3Y22_tig00110045pilonHSYRG00042 [Hibiscus syriacus]|uniref:DYW domain-containing protein n=1 Tax=Hibiscus syriacus TaxID=106335 RepID=A0A6A3BNH5_HIBSY|nr:hypothetical protein F3Y22_tig00110045pilonHSYRG00042 [Hibiscus syriacus]